MRFQSPRCLPLLLAIGLLASACGKRAEAPAPAPAATVQPAAHAGWSDFLKQYQEDYFAANPSFAVVQGRHEFDGKLPDWSPAGIAKEIARLKAQRAKAVAYTGLSPQQSYQRDYLLARIDGDLFWARDSGFPWKNPAWYSGSLEPSVYLTRPYAPLDQRMRAFIAYAKAIPTAAAQIRANLKSPLPKTYVQLGINGFGGFPDFYRKDVPTIFAEVKDEALQTELKAAIEPAAQAMQELADWLKQQQPKANDDFALGADKFAAMLKMTEGVSTPLAELEAIGRADLARNQAALKEACAAFAPKASIVACIAKVGANKPKGGAVEGARAQLAGLKQFLIDQDLVSIPGTEEALVNEAPPYQRWNFAYIDIAGPYDKGMPSTYYISPPDPSWSKKDQNDYLPGQADLLFTSAHEVWPGHFLQFLHANRSPFEFGQLFVGYAFAEGWAHYTEEMMWEAGLGAGSPEIHIGQLSNALLRDVRYLCAIGLHTQGMSVKDCETMFREQGYQDPGNSRQQAARGTYDPAFLNYTMGKLMILKLREDWTASRGGRAAWKAFHDQFLAYGGPPIPLVRAQMLGQGDDGVLFKRPAAQASSAQ